MTHYRVAVITGEEYLDTDAVYDGSLVNRLIAHYDENIQVEPYVYLTKAGAIDEARTRISTYIERGYDSPLIEHKDDSDEELYKYYTRYVDADIDEDGNFITTYNPSAKYDYYTKIDETTIGEFMEYGNDDDIDDDALLDEWNRYVTDGGMFYKPEYYRERYGDFETYRNWMRLPAVWAVVTPDGSWHEPGEVGWFACDDATSDSLREWSATFEERFIIPYTPGTKVVILDCHI